MHSSDDELTEVTPAGRMHTRRSFVSTGLAAAGAVALARTLTGCSDSSSTSGSASTTAGTASDATTAETAPDATAVATPTTPATTGAIDATTTTTASSTTVAEPTSYSVTHAYGTFEIPAQPQRVIAMENRRDLETAVVLGLPLVAVGTFNPGFVAASFVPVNLDGVQILSLAEIDFEEILALQPDLILSRELYLDDGPGLAEVAPVLPIATDGPWRPDLEQVAGWMHRESTLRGALDQYDALLAEVRSRHADRLASASVAIIEFYPADSTFYAGGLDDFQLQANTLQELGGHLVPFLTGRSYFDEPFSIENLAEIDGADAILLVAGSDADRATLDALELWQRVPAVAAGRVVHTDVRTNQGSVYAATECVRLLDELYSLIA